MMMIKKVKKRNSKKLIVKVMRMMKEKISMMKKE